MRTRFLPFILLTVTLLLPLSSAAQRDLDFTHYTRYLALGDSLTAGYGAHPVTHGFTYRLYRQGVYDHIDHTLFVNAGVPGIDSAQLLAYQIPQALVFRPNVITLTVGGNDLLTILEGADAATVLARFYNNLLAILGSLHHELPSTRVYLANLYTIPQIPNADVIVPLFNQYVTAAAAAYSVPVADLYSAFLDRPELLLINKQGANHYEVHPTPAGYRVMAEVFKALAEPRP